MGENTDAHITLTIYKDAPKFPNKYLDLCKKCLQSFDTWFHPDLPA